MYRYLKLWSFALGLVAWAVVLWMRVPPAADLAPLQASASARVSVVFTPSGEQLYATACAGCHQASGEGRFPVFPPLAGSPWVNGDSDRLVAATLHGISGPISVNGMDYSGLMPGFSHLDDQEIAEVLTHVRSAWGNRAAPIAASEVAAVRMATADRRTPWSAEELAPADEDAP